MRGHIKLFALPLDIERTRRFKAAWTADTCSRSCNLAAMPVIGHELRHDYKV